MGRPVVHWEFWSEEPDRISRFYQQVFDWKIQPMAEIDYTLVDTGGSGGILKPKRGPWPARLTFYIDVNDLDAYVRKIKQAGGKILVERQEVTGVGQFSLFEDPDGRVLGMWKQQR